MLARMALEFAEWIQREWKVIKKAPFTFVTLSLIAGTIGFALSAWHYSERISILESRISEQNERLGIAYPTDTTYAKLTNQELKKEVARFVPKLRAFSERVQKNEPQIYRHDEEERNALQNAKTDNERKEIQHRFFVQETQEMIANYQSIETEYNRDYKTTAIVLHDEMVRRLKITSNGSQILREDQSLLSGIHYDFLAGPSPVEDIATDLERLAELLPDKAS